MRPSICESDQSNDLKRNYWLFFRDSMYVYIMGVILVIQEDIYIYIYAHTIHIYFFHIRCL
jgi:hypothetical protein